MRLERAHLMRERALGEVHPLGCVRELSRVGDRHQRAQVTQVYHAI